MVARVRRDGSDRLDMPGVVVHPQPGVAAHQVELQLAAHEQQAEALPAGCIEERARDDGAGRRLGLDPGRQRQRPTAAVDAVEGVGVRLLQVGVERLRAPPAGGAAVHEAPAVEVPLARGRQREVGRQAVLLHPDDRLGVAERLLPQPLRLLDLRLEGGELRLGGRVPLLDRLELRLLLGRGCVDDRRRVAGLLPDARFGNAVEVREELVELLLRDGIELVVVAARAAHRQAQPHGAGRGDAIDDALHEELLRDDAHLRVHAVVAVEPGGDLLVQRRVRQQIARELLDREPIEGQVPVEGVDDPVAPARHVAPLVREVAGRVREARRRQPGRGHPLAVAGGGQQPIDGLLVGVRGIVGHERRHLGGGRRQAGQVERHPPQQRGTVGRG